MIRDDIHIAPLRQIGGRPAHTDEARTDALIAALTKR
jgi:hypothetical protein